MTHRRKPQKPANPLTTPASLCCLAAIGGLLAATAVTQPAEPETVTLELTMGQVRTLNAMFEREARIDKAEAAILTLPPVITPSPSRPAVPRPPRLSDARTLAREAARAEGLDPALLHGLILAESSGCTRNLSKAGAIGCTQLMPGTARELGVDPHDRRQNVRGGAIHLKRMIARYRDETIGLVAYNWGSGNTDRWLARGGQWERLPAETKAYVGKVKVKAALLRRETQLAME